MLWNNVWNGGSMIDLVRLSDEGLINWLRARLQKWEFMYGHAFSEQEICENIYKMLFQERRTRLKDIEQYFIPFSQANYLTAKQKLEIMIFVLEKERGNRYQFLCELGRTSIVNEQWIDKLYLNWIVEDRLHLSPEDKKAFFVRSLSDRLGLGVFSLLERIALDGILLGELCPSPNNEPPEKRIAVYNNGKIIMLPFLALEDKEELIRIIKAVVARENNGELTVMEPFWECVRDDGTYMTAVRPPTGKDWGLRILYMSGERSKEWEK